MCHLKNPIMKSTQFLNATAKVYLRNYVVAIRYTFNGPLSGVLNKMKENATIISNPLGSLMATPRTKLLVFIWKATGIKTLRNEMMVNDARIFRIDFTFNLIMSRFSFLYNCVFRQYKGEIVFETKINRHTQ